MATSRSRFPSPLVLLGWKPSPKGAGGCVQLGMVLHRDGHVSPSLGSLSISIARAPCCPIERLGRCGRGRQWREAVRLLGVMRRKGVKVNSIVLCNTISACARVSPSAACFVPASRPRAYRARPLRHEPAWPMGCSRRVFLRLAGSPAPNRCLARCARTRASTGYMSCVPECLEPWMLPAGNEGGMPSLARDAATLHRGSRCNARPWV